MPAGFETFDGAGRPMVTLTERVSKVLGSIDVSNTGSLAVPRFAEGIPFAFSLPLATPTAQSAPAVSISGTTLVWDYFGAAARTPVVIIFGVY